MNEGDSSTIAYVVLALWVPITVAFFFTMRPDRALLFSVLGALLFLPEAVQFKFPLMPPFSKHNLPYVCAFVCVLVRMPRQVFRPPRERWFYWLAIVFIVGAIGTALTNGDALRYGKWHKILLPGLTLKDGFFTGIDQAVHAALPFFLGLLLFRTSKQLTDLLAAFVIAGLIYVPFAAVEIRMSPQFHNWVYGYAQHSFLQTMRFGGYRPMVFMSHGLALGRFLVVASVSALVIAQRRKTVLGIPCRIAAAILFITLVLCKSTGAIVFGAVGLAVTMFCGPRIRQWLAVALAAMVLFYPAMRAANVFPVSQVEEASSIFGAERQQSLAFRFDNEELLLAKARERIAFGWGEYNRNATYDEMARPSVTDGHWIILFGITGVTGFIAAFGILLLPLFIVQRRLKRIAQPSDALLVSGASMILGFIALDLIPNGLWDDYPYLLAGALVGVTRLLVTREARARVTALAVRRGAPSLEPIAPI